MKNEVRMAKLVDLDYSWMKDARCRQEQKDTTLFFEDFERGTGQLKSQMVVFCSNCSVREDCYNYAIEAGETGLWGGAYFTSGRPRNPLRAKYLETQRDMAAAQAGN